MCCKDENHMHQSRNGSCGAHHAGRAHGTCGCGERGFLSKEEKTKMLVEYRESLKRELEGVEEELKGLKEE
jgi:hypothetical protein